MRLNPYKFAEGGGSIFLPVGFNFESPNIYWQQQQVAASDGGSSSSKKSSSSKNDEDKEDKIFGSAAIDKLITEGLPNEVDDLLVLYMKNKRQLERTGTVRPADLIAMRSLAQRIKFNANAYKSAVSTMTTNQAQDSIAISQSGNVYYQDDDGEIRTTSLERYDVDTHGSLLTNQQLAELRAYSPSLSQDSEVISTIKSSISNKDVIDFIGNVLQTVKSSETKNGAVVSLNKIGAVNTSNLTKSMIESLEEVNEDDILMHVQMGTKSNDKQISAAMQVIQNMMPIRMKQFLIANGLKNGLDYEEAFMNCIYQLSDKGSYANMYRQNDSTTNYTIASNQNSIGAGGSGSSSKTYKHTTTGALFTSAIDRTEHATFMDNKNDESIALTVEGRKVGKISNISGDETFTEGTPLSAALSGTDRDGWAKYLDYGRIYRPDTKINESDITGYAYDGKEVGIFNMPVTESGELNIKLLAQIEELCKNVDSNNAEEVNKALENAGLSKYVTAVQNGDDVKFDFNEKYKAPFFIAYVYAVDDTLPGMPNDPLAIPFIEELKGSWNPFYLSSDDSQIRAIKNKAQTEYERFKINYKKYNWDEDKIEDDIYHFPVFIGMATDYISSATIDMGSIQDPPISMDTFNQNQRLNRNREILQQRSNSSEIGNIDFLYGQ